MTLHVLPAPFFLGKQQKCFQQISQHHLKVTRWMSFTTELQVSLKEPIFISLSEIPALLQFFHI